MNGYTESQTDMHGSTAVGWWWPWRELPLTSAPGRYCVTIGGINHLDNTEQQWAQNYHAVVDDFGTLRKVAR